MRTAVQGTSGQVNVTRPPNTTRNVVKITMVLIVTAPTQYPGSLSNSRPQPEQYRLMPNQDSKAGTPQRGHRRRRARPRRVPALGSRSADIGARVSSAPVIREEVARLRKEYESTGLHEDDMADNPFTEFESWFAGVVQAGIHEPNAFVLATADSSGAPSARAVLMKELGRSGLVFYTGLTSRKSDEIKSNPRAAATFVWTQLHRQVRIEGHVAPVEKDMADAYFASRPRGAQIAAHASRQSAVVERREYLDEVYERLSEEFGDDPIPRPERWGGWRLEPTSVEFWQGRPNRFHDRIRYRLVDGAWIKERLAP